MEIDFGRQVPVYGIVIKGSPIYDEYVTSFIVLYSPDDSSNFYYVLNQETPPRPQIFRGNFYCQRLVIAKTCTVKGSLDAFTPVQQIFSTPFEATKVRIKPQTWNNAISLRVEILGCSDEEPTTTPSFEYLTSKAPVALCDDEMGLSDGSLVDQQISVSSEATGHGKKHIRFVVNPY